MSTREKRLEALLVSLRERIDGLGSGADIDADPNDPSPTNMDSWLAGLMVQEIDAALADESADDGFHGGIVELEEDEDVLIVSTTEDLHEEVVEGLALWKGTDSSQPLCVAAVDGVTVVRVPRSRVHARRADESDGGPPFDEFEAGRARGRAEGYLRSIAFLETHGDSYRHAIEALRDDDAFDFVRDGSASYEIDGKFVDWLTHQAEATRRRAEDIASTDTGMAFWLHGRESALRDLAFLVGHDGAPRVELDSVKRRIASEVEKVRIWAGAIPFGDDVTAFRQTTIDLKKKWQEMADCGLVDPNALDGVASAFLIESHPSAKRETVRVRCGVSVETDGSWFCGGGSDCGDDYNRSLVLDDAGRDAAFYWVEADLPVPTIPVAETIEGEVMT